ncbi:hypothetical protein EDD22DRAFT_845578 [Suillus occidentalis]|nr:hypothetical protein EDD22DRAFT_845578 [Suillus occidentalis]
MAQGYKTDDDLQRTLGDSKVTVYQHMGATIFPQLHSLNAVTVGERVKWKYEHLTKKYKELAHQLRQQVKAFKLTQMTICPMVTTNILSVMFLLLDQMRQLLRGHSQFRFFPVLHRILSSHPNVTPIAIPTGIGPHGKKTVHFQVPSDDEGDEVGFSADQDQQSQMLTLHGVLKAEATRCKPPKALSLSQSSVEKARHCISKVPEKRSLDETLMDMQRASLEAIGAHAAVDLCLQECQILLKEFEAGIWDVDKYQAKLSELSGTSEKPEKHTRYSPDWSAFE